MADPLKAQNESWDPLDCTSSRTKDDCVLPNGSEGGAHVAVLGTIAVVVVLVGAPTSTTSPTSTAAASTCMTVATAAVNIAAVAIAVFIFMFCGSPHDLRLCHASLGVPSYRT